MNEREKFEQYWCDKYDCSGDDYWFESGSYGDDDMQRGWETWQAATAQAVPKPETYYALKDEYFEEQYFELGCVIDDFKSDYATGDICELLCADITTIKRPNKFIVTLPSGETRVFDTREEALSAIDAAMIQAAQEDE